MPRESPVQQVTKILTDRFPKTPWADWTEKGILSIQRQMPRSHTEKYELKTIWYWYPLYCLGGISFIAFIILTITGIILGFYYVPDGTITFDAEGNPSSPAYNSVKYIMTEVPFGYINRAVHHWAAHVMVAAVFMHMARVYFTGAYKNPREINWIIGVILLLVTIIFGYSGYLLPWNDLSFGAANIGVNMTKAGGPPAIGNLMSGLLFAGTAISAGTVLRMYWLHVFVLPMIGIGLMLLHMGLVWIQGISEPH